MVLPRLIHPIPVTIEQIDRAGTVYDHEAREPIGQAAHKAPVTLSGQPRWLTQRELDSQPIGASDNASGYILFRYVDLKTSGLVAPDGSPGFDVNDRITLSGNIRKEVYVTRIEPLGHYPDQGGASLVKCWFRDREPAKTR